MFMFNNKEFFGVLDNKGYKDFYYKVAKVMNEFYVIKQLPYLKEYNREIQIITGVFLNYLQHYNHNGFIKAEKILLSLEFNIKLRFWIDNKNNLTVYYQGKQLSVDDYTRLIYSLIQTFDTVKAVR